MLTPKQSFGWSVGYNVDKIVSRLFSQVSRRRTIAKAQSFSNCEKVSKSNIWNRTWVSRRTKRRFGYWRGCGLKRRIRWGYDRSQNYWNQWSCCPRQSCKIALKCLKFLDFQVLRFPVILKFSRTFLIFFWIFKKLKNLAILKKILRFSRNYLNFEIFKKL